MEFPKMLYAKFEEAGDGEDYLTTTAKPFCIIAPEPGEEVVAVYEFKGMVKITKSMTISAVETKPETTN